RASRCADGRRAARRQLHSPISDNYISPSTSCQTAPCSWSSARPGARAPATSFPDSSLSVVVLGVVVSGHLSSSSSFPFHQPLHVPPASLPPAPCSWSSRGRERQVTSFLWLILSSFTFHQPLHVPSTSLPPAPCSWSSRGRERQVTSLWLILSSF